MARTIQQTDIVDPSFAPIVEAFAKDRQVAQGKMFGSLGLKVNGKVFVPGHGKRMREWVSVPSGKAAWLELAREAHRFVKGGK